MCSRSVSDSTVHLICEVQYLLCDNITNIEVNWYRTMREDTAGMEGERLTSVTSSYRWTQVTNSTIATELFLLEIRNFSATSDTGYYWCQLVVNNVSLSPSPYGYIYSSDCVLQDYVYDTRNQPLCAQNLTVFQAWSNEERCTSKYTPISPTTSDNGDANTATDYTIQPDAISTATTTDIKFDYCDFSRSGYPCATGITMAVAIVSIIITLIIVVGVFLCVQKFIKSQGNKIRIYRDIDFIPHHIMCLCEIGSRNTEAAVSHYETIDTNGELQVEGEESDPYYSQVMTAVESYSSAECDMEANISYDVVQRSNVSVTTIARSDAMAATMMADTVYDDVQSLDVKGNSLQQQ